MMEVFLFIVLAVTQVASSSCNGSLTLTDDTIKRLQAKLLSNSTDQGVLLSLSIDSIDNLNITADAYFVLFDSSWIFARDLKAVFLLQLPEVAAITTTTLFGLHEYVYVDLDSDNPRCRLTKDDVITFFNSGIWIDLKGNSGKKLLFDHMCVRNNYDEINMINNDTLSCWYENGNATAFHTFPGMKIAANKFALLIVILFPLILTIFTESGTYLDHDEEECFGLNIRPFPIGIRYCILFWKPSVKLLRYIVFTLRILIIVHVVLASTTVSWIAYDFGYLTALLIGLSIFATLGYSSVTSFYISIYSTPGSQDNALENRLFVSNGQRYFHYIQILFQLLLKIPRMETSELSDFTNGYKVWLCSLFDRKEFALLLFDQNIRDISRPKQVIINVFWLVRSLINVIILSPLIVFISWILTTSVDFFKTRASKCVKYVSLASFLIVVLASFFIVVVIPVLTGTFLVHEHLLITRIYEISSVFLTSHFLAMVILSTLNMYFGSHYAAKQVLDCLYNFMYAVIHLFFMALLLIFWIPVIIKNFTFLILTPFCILVAVIFYPENTSYYLFVVVIMTYVILKPMSDFTDEYSNLFRRIIRLRQEIQKNEKQLHMSKQLSNKPNDLNTARVSTDDIGLADETSENNSHPGNEPDICVIERNLTVQAEAEQCTDQHDVRRSLITSVHGAEPSDMQVQRVQDIDEPHVKSRIFWELVKKYKPFPLSIVRMLLNICVPTVILFCGYEILRYVGDVKSLTKLQQLIGATLFTLGLPIINIIVHSNEAEQRREGTMDFRLRRDIIRLSKSPQANF